MTREHTGAGCGDTVTWERLNIGDLIPMWVEDRSTAMNIALAVLLDAGPLTDRTGRIRLAEARAAVNARLARVSALRRRIRWTRFGQGRPVWVDDVSFDVARHVQAAHLAGANTDRFLSWATSWAAFRLDRSRPLWRMVFVSGLATGEIGVVVVVHHAMADGVAGAALAAALLDPGPIQPLSPQNWRPAPSPTPNELRRDAALRRVADLRRAAYRIGRGPTHRSDMRKTLTALRCRAPDRRLPTPPTEARTTASASWPLDEVRATGHAHCATSMM
jgi:diacylglycerol O-acyltransferase